MNELLVGCTLLLAFANGANDNIKGAATLYGCGGLDYRRALWLGTISVAAGSLLSVFVAGELVRAFSAKGLVPDALLDARFLTATAAGAAATVLLATRIGMPISTTHALLGALAGAGLVVAGSALDAATLAKGFALPLLLSPLLAVALAAAGVWSGRRLEIGNEDTCLVHADVALGRRQLERAVDAGHLVSATMVGFARGLNDTPKILGLLVGAAVVAPVTGALWIAAAMAVGGLVAARRVGHTLAKRIAPMTPGEGLAGNLATSLLVVGASRIGVPVSTTHVSTGGIFGIGLTNGELHVGTAKRVLVAWLTTLPVAASLAALAMWALAA